VIHSNKRTILLLQWKPNYILWWLIYQLVFVFATARIVMFFIRLKDEKFGILSYIRNFVTRTVVRFFVTIFLVFIILLIYFWPNVISLHSQLKKEQKRRKRQTTVGLNGDVNMQCNVSSFGNVQMVSFDIPQSLSENFGKKSSKFFVLHV
jgi:uncharacterized membrane protein